MGSQPSMTGEGTRDNDRISKIKTGDVILCSSNTRTASLLRLFTGSLWNHVGIAIRLTEQKKISLTEEGKLYILEINTMERYDVLTNKHMKGMTLSDFEWVQGRYNQIGVRRMKDSLRVPELVQNIETFIAKYHGYEFAKGILPFIGVWMELPLAGETRGPTMFCTEKTVYFYDECVAPILSKQEGVAYVPGDLRFMFGEDTPYLHNLYKPNHFTHRGNSKGRLWSGQEEIVLRNYTSVFAALLLPLLFTIIIVVMILLVLPRNRSEMSSALPQIG